MSCRFCDNAVTNSELNINNDFSSICIGSSEKGRNMYLTTGNNQPTIIDVLEWNESAQRNLTVCYYVPKFCPECGRELIENIKYFKK